MNHKGFTLVESLLSLIIISFALMLFSQSAQILKKHNLPYYQREDEVSIHQMRLLYALSSNVEIKDKMLHFTYYGNEMRFLISQNRLILTEGYQVFLNDIKNAWFVKEGGCIYIYYEHQERNEKKRLIGC